MTVEKTQRQTQEFFKGLIQKLMMNSSITPQVLERALRFIRSPKKRKLFVYELSNERANVEKRELQNVQFLLLSSLFKAAFDSMIIEGSCVDRNNYGKDALLLVNMSMTYYRTINGQKQYIAETLKTHQAFIDSSFWQHAFKQEVKQEYAKQTSMNAGLDWSTTSQHEDKPSDSHEEQLNMIRQSTLHFFALAFSEFGRSKEEYFSFCKFICKLYKIQLSDQDINDMAVPFQQKKESQQNQKNSQEKLEQKVARMILEKQIEHDFEVARAMKDVKLNPEMMFECEIAQILSGDMGMELYAEESEEVVEGFHWK